jgi:hypothetical protein
MASNRANAGSTKSFSLSPAVAHGRDPGVEDQTLKGAIRIVFQPGAAGIERHVLKAMPDVAEFIFSNRGFAVGIGANDGPTPVDTAGDVDSKPLLSTSPTGRKTVPAILDFCMS